MRKLRPCGKVVVMTRIVRENIANADGVIIYGPDRTDERPVEALVIAIGPECVFVRPGDRVLLPVYNVSDTEIDGEPVALAHESLILAKIREVEN